MPRLEKHLSESSTGYSQQRAAIENPAAAATTGAAVAGCARTTHNQCQHLSGRHGQGCLDIRAPATRVVISAVFPYGGTALGAVQSRRNGGHTAGYRERLCGASVAKGGGSGGVAGARWRPAPGALVAGVGGCRQEA